MADFQKIILISAFEAFAGRSSNRSQEVLGLLPDSIADFRVVKVVLPVVFQKAAEILIEKIDSLGSSLHEVISIGECPSVAIRCELIARNTMHTKSYADNAGCSYETPVAIDADGPATRALGSGRFLAHLGSVGDLKCDWVESDSAGTFVCNDLAFRVTAALSETALPYSFIHIPHYEVSEAPSSHAIVSDFVKLFPVTL